MDVEVRILGRDGADQVILQGGGIGTGGNEVGNAAVRRDLGQIEGTRVRPSLLVGDPRTRAEVDHHWPTRAGSGSKWARVDVRHSGGES